MRATPAALRHLKRAPGAPAGEAVNWAAGCRCVSDALGQSAASPCSLRALLACVPLSFPALLLPALAGSRRHCAASASRRTWLGTCASFATGKPLSRRTTRRSGRRRSQRCGRRGRGAQRGPGSELGQRSILCCRRGWWPPASAGRDRVAGRENLRRLRCGTGCVFCRRRVLVCSLLLFVCLCRLLGQPSTTRGPGGRGERRLL